VRYYALHNYVLCRSVKTIGSPYNKSWRPRGE